MKRVFQIIARKDGGRSQPFILTDAQLCKVLQDDGMDNDDYYVLVLGDENAETYSDVPLLSATHYVAMFGQLDWTQLAHDETYLPKIDADNETLGDR